MKPYFCLLFFFFACTLSAQSITHPPQAQSGLGSADYMHAAVDMHDFAE